MATRSMAQTRDEREERRTSTSGAVRSGSSATRKRLDGPLASRQRGAGNQAVNATVRTKAGPEPTADLCTRCTRRYRAGKPLDCPECEQRLPTPPESKHRVDDQRRFSLATAPRCEDGCNLSRRSAALETECDVRIHPEDMDDYLTGNAFRTKGTGTPQIKERMPGVLASNPCLK